MLLKPKIFEKKKEPVIPCGKSHGHHYVIWFILSKLFLYTFTHSLPLPKKIQQVVQLALIFAEGSENRFAHTLGLAGQTFGKKVLKYWKAQWWEGEREPKKDLRSLRNFVCTPYLCLPKGRVERREMACLLICHSIFFCQTHKRI